MGGGVRGLGLGEFRERGELARWVLELLGRRGRIRGWGGCWPGGEGGGWLAGLMLGSGWMDE